jgi:SAM-dependent methyltransferase
VSWLTAALYDRMMRGVEEAGLQRWRAELLRGLEGEVLEVGAGTGVNLPHYPPAVRRVVHVEPDPHMRRRLARRLGAMPYPVEMVPAPLEALDHAPGSFDAIVATLVFCSVPDQPQALHRAWELLRPGGRLVFLEHVASDDPAAAAWQRRLDPLWCRVMGGCHLTRDTEAAIRAAGFDMERVTRAPMRRAPKLVRATIRGVARKPVRALG